MKSSVQVCASISALLFSYTKMTVWCSELLKHSERPGMSNQSNSLATTQAQVTALQTDIMRQNIK